MPGQTRTETSEVEKPASVPTSAKAAPGIFPSVDIIQDEPVSNVAVEGLATPFTSQRRSADTSFGGEPPFACKGEGPSPALEGAKAPPFLLELFCGTAGVCAQFRTQGGRALGVDHHLKRAKLKAAAVQLDLTQQWVQDLIVKEITLGRVSGIHLGPPCGTASKARNIPIKRKLVKRGAPNPQPLRSSAYPLGFPWLKGLNKVKVQAANCLYEFSANLVMLCEKYDVLFTVENPENSLMWETPFFKPLLQRFYFHVIDACEYGSEHKKSTAFLANFDAPRLKQRCSGDHSHAAWKVRQLESGDWAFDTAKEAEYPSKLAHELAASFLEELAKRGDIYLQDELVDHAVKISAESQPRRTKGPLLLSEFKSKVAIECVEDDNPPLCIPEDAKPPWQGIPVGAKRLDLQPVSDGTGGSGRLKAIYGVYFSPQEFVQRVQQLTHPFDVPLPLDESNMESIVFILERGPAGVAKHRADMLQHYIGRARALQQDELKLHETLNESIQPVMATKRLLLFKEMMADAGVTDPLLFEELCNGFRLVGDLSPSGQFPPQWKPAVLGIEQLRQTAVWAQRAVVGSCKRVLEDSEIAAAVWQETMEQAAEDKRWVRGPFSSEEITAKHGKHWIPSRRFGVRQSGKIRSVDDFSQFLVNSTVTCHEKIDLEGIDHICATARFFLGAMRDEHRWRIPGEDGVSSGSIAAEWRSTKSRDLVGRCLDLKHAYKQLVRNPCDAWASILAVANPEDNNVYYFEAIALPFGSVSSVIGFNRAARALRMILTRLFKLVVTNLFDDFCQIELAPISDGAWKTAELVLTLLGWRISMGDEKRKAFSKRFEILGAIVTFPPPGGETIEVTNKESRLLQLKQQVNELKGFLKATAPRAMLESLKGRLLYAAGHTYGRTTQLACQLLHKFGGQGPSVTVTPELVHVVSEALSLLMEAKPRLVQSWSEVPPILLFTDGAVEDSLKSVTHGAVLVDPWKQQSFFMGDNIPSDFVQLWTRSGKKQVIAQAEIFPVVIAKATWSTSLEGRSILWFLDNESARMSLVRNFSPILDSFFLLQLNARMDVSVQSRNWYSRVPSKSNPSDSASRLQFSEYRNSARSVPDYSIALKALEDSWKLVGLIEKGR